jgi:hypothetical protein
VLENGRGGFLSASTSKFEPQVSSVLYAENIKMVLYRDFLGISLDRTNTILLTKFYRARCPKNLDIYLILASPMHYIYIFI